MAKKKKKKKSSKSAKKAEIEKSAAKSVRSKSSLDLTLKSARSESSLDVAVKSAEKTKTDLQGLLSAISEGKEISPRKIKEEKRIEPQLSHETKAKTAEEDILKDSSFSDIISTKTREETMTDTEVHIPPSLIEIPSKENIYEQLNLFFKDFMEDYSKRYDRWEGSISSILDILRKMQKITRKNSDDLIHSINNLFEKMRTSLNQFKVKGDAVEKVAGVELLRIYDEYNKILGLLKLKIKEYRLKRSIDELFQEQKLIL